MPNDQLNSQIRARINEFAGELSDLVKQAALEAVQGALDGGGAPAKRRGPGRPRGSTTRLTKMAGRRAGRPRTKKLASTAQVLAQVKKSEGIGVTEIAKALRTSSDAVKPVMIELLASKQVRKTGQKRGTKYHAGSARKASTRKGSKKKASRKAARKRGGRKKAAGKRRTTKRPLAVAA